jgi:hypothetical protein
MKFRLHVMPLETTPFSDTKYMARLSRMRLLWIRPQDHIAIGRNITTESSNDTTWNRTRDLPSCRSLPTVHSSGFSGLVVSMLASGTQDRGFAPGLSRWIIRAKKSSAYLPSEGK